jgi:predicted small secreted protein
MKKQIALVAIAVMSITLASCEERRPAGNNTNQPGATTSEESETAPGQNDATETPTSPTPAP